MTTELFSGGTKLCVRLTTVAPRCESASSQNSATIGCRSSVAWTISALYAAPSAVHDAHFTEPSLRRSADIFFDDHGDVPRLKGVKVEHRFDWKNVNRVLAAMCHWGRSLCSRNDDNDNATAVAIALFPSPE